MGQIMDMLNRIFDDLFGDSVATDPDEWTDIVTAGPFDERTVVSQALYKSRGFGPGASFDGHPNYLRDGTLLHVPENTAAYIFAQGGIEQVLTEPGAMSTTRASPIPTTPKDEAGVRTRDSPATAPTSDASPS